MVIEENKTKLYIENIKKLQKKLSKIPSNFKIKNEKFKKLQNDLTKVKNWKLNLLRIENEEETYYKLPYISKLAKKLIENFYTFEAKHPYENLKEGLKISQLTHHSFCNVPVISKAYKDTERRTDNILFYPATKLETEREYTFIKTKEKKEKFLIEILKIYEDLALKSILLYKIEKIEINKNLINIPEKPEELDLKTIKAQAIAISKDESKNKIPLKKRTAIYKEYHPVTDYEILSECKIIKKDKKITAEIITEEGEVINYENLHLKRPVAFTVFGIGFEKEIGWFPCAMVINVFKRKDILSKKSSPEEYKEKHTYHLNGKKLQVNYKNLYLKGIFGIEKIPSLWSYASITANNEKLNITIPIPIQRKVKDKETKTEKWQRVKPSSIAKAVYQILGTEKIKYKDEEIYLPGKRMYIEKDLKEIKEPTWLNDAKNLITTTINSYKILQAIKRGLDKLEESTEELEELKEYLEIKEIKAEG